MPTNNDNVTNAGVQGSTPTVAFSILPYTTLLEEKSFRGALQLWPSPYAITSEVLNGPTSLHLWILLVIETGEISGLQYNKQLYQSSRTQLRGTTYSSRPEYTANGNVS